MDRELRILFEPFGAIKEIIVKTKQGSSNSYCFIEYQDVDSAAKAQSEYIYKHQDCEAKILKENNSRLSLVEEKGKTKIADRRHFITKR